VKAYAYQFEVGLSSVLIQLCDPLGLSAFAWNRLSTEFRSRQIAKTQRTTAK